MWMASSLPVLVAQPDEDMQTEQHLCWSGMTDSVHSTSGSNEEDNPPFHNGKVFLLEISYPGELLNFNHHQEFTAVHNIT